IFDNATVGDIKELRPGGKLCGVIVTTRNQNLPFSLDVPEKATVRLRSLPKKDALDLLRKILGDTRINSELAAAKQLAQLVGRLPLALQVVGANLRRKPCSLETFLESLQGQKNKLKLVSRLRLRGDTDFDVEASLNLSLELLQPEEIDFFACLSVCAEEGFALETAIATAGCEDQWDAEEFLDRLCELSLLNYVETEENRFVLHPLIREYAKSLAEERELLTSAAKRHAEFFLEWLQSENFDDETVVTKVAKNLDDVIIATEWLQNNEAETKQRNMEDYQFVLQLQDVFEEYGYWDKAITLMRRFQSWAEEFDDWNLVVRYQMHEARYLSFSEDFEQAEDRLNVAKANLPKIADQKTRKRRESKVLNVLGGVFDKQNKRDEAIQTFREELLIDEELNNHRFIAIVCNRLGNLLISQDKLEEAQQAFERNIAIAQTLDDQSSVAIRLNCLGGVLEKQRKLEEAQKAFEQQIAIAQTLDDQSQLAITWNCLGKVLQKKGELEEAQQAFEQQIAIAQTLDDQSSLAIGWNCLGGLFEKQGKLEEAQQAFEQQIAIAQTLDDQLPLAIVLNCLGKVLQKQGKLEEAQQAFEQQIAIAQTLNDKSNRAIGFQYLAEVLQKQEVEIIQNSFEKRIASSKETNNELALLGIAMSLQCFGKLLQQQGKLQKAQKAFEQEIAITKQLNNQSQLAIGWNRLGRVLHKQGKLKEAQNAFEQEIAIAKQLNNQSPVAIGWNHLGRVLHKQGKLKEAKHAFEDSIRIANTINNHFCLISSCTSLWKLLKQQVNLEEAQNIFQNNMVIVEILNNKPSKYASILHSLAILEKSKRNFDQARQFLQQSQEIYEDKRNLINLAKVLTTLGTVLIKQKKWDEAENILRQGYDLAVSLKDKQGEAIIANSLGQLKGNQKGQQNLKLAKMYFNKGIFLEKELNDKKGMAKVHTAMGEVLIIHHDFENAVEQLSQGFEIDENFKNIRGLEIIIRDLTYALSKLRRQKEALEYCDRCLKIAPNNPNFISLYNKVKTAIDKRTELNLSKTGVVSFIKHNKKYNLHWGRIKPDDGSDNITFNENYIGLEVIYQLKKGTLVEVEFYERHGQYYATEIFIIEEDEDEIIEEENEELEYED
ncbi:MAG: tetratricopeptide repeat protein, partial [Crocosphaera sp.]